MQKAKAAAQGHFSGADLQVQGLRDEHIRAVEAARALAAKTLKLERTLSDLVNRACGLTPAEIGLTWKTAPPQIPISPPSDHRRLMNVILQSVTAAVATIPKERLTVTRARARACM